MLIKEPTTKIYNMISNMNISFGNAKGVSLENGKLTENGKKRLYNQLLNLYDENRELRDDAFIPKIRKEIFDAIADICVFLYGGNHFINQPLSDFTLKFTEEEGITLADGKHFPLSEIDKAREYFAKNSFEILKNIIDKVIRVSETGDLEQYQKDSEELSIALHVAFELFKKTDKPEHTMLYLNELVNQSNLSKLCRNMDEVNDTLDFYAKKNVAVDFKESELLQENGKPFLIVYSIKDQIVQDMKNGKLLFDDHGVAIMKEYRKDKFLKNTKWFEPDLSQF